MLGEAPVELGLKGHEQEFLNTLRRDPRYQRLFPAAFPDEGDVYTLKNVTSQKPSPLSSGRLRVLASPLLSSLRRFHIRARMASSFRILSKRLAQSLQMLREGMTFPLN
jgi:hypothetical protein